MNQISRFQRPLPYRYYNATIGIMVVNVLFFLIMYLAPGTFGLFALIPLRIIRGGAVWQVVTYMFMHGSFWHIFFNMIVLFLFGTQLEKRWGSHEFLLYYLVTGIGAGIFTLVLHWYTGKYMVPVVGASGAIYGLLLAYAVMFPDSRIFIFGILPLRAPIAVLVFAGLSLFYHITGTAAGIAHLTHLAGMVVGFLYFFIRFRMNPLKVFFR